MTTYTAHKSWLASPSLNEFNNTPNTIQMVSRDMFFELCIKLAKQIESHGLKTDINSFEKSLKAYRKVLGL